MRTRIGTARATAAAALAATAAACAHPATLRPSMALVGGDGSWSGYVNGCELRVRAADDAALHLTDPMVVVSGRTLLYNSDGHDGRYVHVNTEQVACRAGGRDYSQTADGCLGRGSAMGTEHTCTTRLDGCAEPVDGRELRRFARAHGLPAPDPAPDRRVGNLRSDIDACRPGWRKSTTYQGAPER